MFSCVVGSSLGRPRRVIQAAWVCPTEYIELGSTSGWAAFASWDVTACASWFVGRYIIFFIHMLASRVFSYVIAIFGFTVWASGPTEYWWVGQQLGLSGLRFVGHYTMISMCDEYCSPQDYFMCVVMSWAAETSRFGRSVIGMGG